MNFPNFPQKKYQEPERPLNKTERKEAREKIEEYHKKKLGELMEYVFEKVEEYKKGKIDAFDLDYVIHIFHKQSQELYSFVNTFYPNNSELPKLLQLMKEEEEGVWKWIPRTKQ